MKNNHSITNIYLHFVFVTRWRKNYPFDSDDDIFWENLALQLNCQIYEINRQDNHYHILVDLHPSISVSEFACKVKSLFSGYYAKKCKYWEGFQTGYYCSSVGTVNLEKVKNYIQNQ